MGGAIFTNKNKIGEGPSAEIFKIKKKNKECAAKLFKRPIKFMSSQEEKALEIEQEILKTINHPFIIKYIEEFTY